MCRLFLIAVACLAPGFALAQSTNATATTYEIYGLVGLTFLIGFLYVFFKSRSEQRRRQDRNTSRKATA